MRNILAAALVLAFVTPALAEDFYVVRDTKAKKCTVVTKKPTVTTTTVVGDTVYKTRTEAQSAIKTLEVCTSR
jgi:hypothetical protein